MEMSILNKSWCSEPSSEVSGPGVVVQNVYPQSSCIVVAFGFCFFFYIAGENNVLGEQRTS